MSTDNNRDASGRIDIADDASTRDRSLRDRVLGFRNFIFLTAKAITLVGLVAIFIYFFSEFYHEATFYFKGNVLFILVYAFLFACFLYTYRGMQIGSQKYRDLIAAVLLTCLITDTAAYFLICLFAEKMLHSLPMIVAFTLQIAFGMVSYLLLQRLLRWLNPPLDAIAIIRPDDEHANIDMQEGSTAFDSGNHPDRINLEKFTEKNTRVRISTIVAEEVDLEGVSELLKPYKAVVIGQIDRNIHDEVLRCAYRNKKKVILLPDVQDVLLHSATTMIIEDALTIVFKDHKLSPDQLLLKRIVDIIVSFVLLVLTLPISLLSAIAIKLYDRGPVLYRQVRLTRNGVPFTLLKFRSMRVDAEKDVGAVLATTNDSRVTPVGKFIRSTRIDELPQLINVLLGDMSMVGPRPERPELYDKIVEDCPEYHDRMAVKAGLTGYAQLYGKYNTSFHNKLIMDLYYIETASLLMDLRLLLYTVKIVFSKESTEGVALNANIVTELELGRDERAEDQRKASA